MTDYADFLKSKDFTFPDAGIQVGALNGGLFPFQEVIVRWALRKGRACIFADCGMGKTLMQLEWAHRICEHTHNPVLILAPLAVSSQTVKEGEKFGIEVTRVRKESELTGGINITNYEMAHHFNPANFQGIVLDESSILKDYAGKFRNYIIESFRGIPYKLACTATPAPNDYMELGNHAEFVGIMSRAEMLSMFFYHDSSDTKTWVLKGHAEDDFWKWLCHWSVYIRKPADLGFENDGLCLPEIRYHEHFVESKPQDGCLFPMELHGIGDRRKARRGSLNDRCHMAAEIINSTEDGWVVWCDLNDESKTLTDAIDGAVEVKGADSSEQKEKSLLGFSNSDFRVIVTKPSIAGHGMNWQHCHNVAFVGLSDSWEQFYQATRRVWRFGQKYPVDVHIILSELEGTILENIRRKESDANQMAENMAKHMREYMRTEVLGMERERDEYRRDIATGNGWELHLGDCVEIISEMESDTIDYSIFSPPFASLYTYTNSLRDMGNCRSVNQFADHFAYLVKQLYRVMKPGRLLSFHCMSLPTSKSRDGFIGLRDFRGELIEIFIRSGWIFHSEVCIWKDPVTAMQRTKALGLLYKQLRKDSAMSRQGIPDYLITMRKPGTNPDPVTHTPDSFPLDTWQRYASPVWTDIRQSRVLKYQEARDNKDERHICPLQLDVIERGIELWSNPNDLILSPFAGIGSEGFVAVRSGRRFVGCELKESYWNIARRNLIHAEHERNQTDNNLFCLAYAREDVAV